MNNFQFHIYLDIKCLKIHTLLMIKIKMEMTDAIAFFGSKKKIADVCGYTRGTISEWGMGELAQNSAFKLAYISKLPQFRRKGKLKHEITIQ